MDLLEMDLVGNKNAFIAEYIGEYDYSNLEFKIEEVILGDAEIGPVIIKVPKFPISGVEESRSDPQNSYSNPQFNYSYSDFLRYTTSCRDNLIEKLVIGNDYLILTTKKHHHIDRTQWYQNILQLLPADYPQRESFEAKNEEIITCKEYIYYLKNYYDLRGNFAKENHYNKLVDIVSDSNVHK